MLDRVLTYSFFLPVPLVAWAGIRWYRVWTRIASRRQKVLTSICFAACALSAVLIPTHLAILALLPTEALNDRFLVLIRALQVGLPCALVGLLLSPFAAKAGRILVSAASLLLLSHWYLLGQVF